MKSHFTKTITALLALSALFTQRTAAQIFCKSNGNVIIYSNYDGGYLNIDVDENIPDLKIGITTYEDCEVTISGPYASNVTQVIYAGYQGDNQHCNPSPLTTSVNGVNANLVTILQFPSATWSNPFGYPYIICNYQCDSASYQGGCNTPDQIAHYYLTEFGGLLYYHFTQYGCWSGTYNVSDGGNCCIGEDILPPLYSLQAAFSASADTVCAEQGIFFTNNSSNTYPGAPSYVWNFGDGSPEANTENASHGYSVTGTYTVTLTITDSSGVASDVQTMVITVINCGTGVEVADGGDQLLISSNLTSEILTIQITKPLQLPASVTLLDVSGKVCAVTASEGSTFVFDVGNLSSGLYILQVEGSNYCIVKKVVVE